MQAVVVREEDEEENTSFLPLEDVTDSEPQSLLVIQTATSTYIHRIPAKTAPAWLDGTHSEKSSS